MTAHSLLSYRAILGAIKVAGPPNGSRLWPEARENILWNRLNLEPALTLGCQPYAPAADVLLP
jgi:hypothetical protein